MSLGTCMQPWRLLLVAGERAEQLTTGEMGVVSGTCLDCACHAVESLVQPEVIGGQ